MRSAFGVYALIAAVAAAHEKIAVLSSELLESEQARGRKSVSHTCIHDEIMKEVTEKRILAGLPAEPAPRGLLNPSIHEPHSRHLTSTASWRQMRIKIDYQSMSGLTGSDLTYFKEKIIEPTVDTVKSMLQVRQRPQSAGGDSKLFLGYPCSGYYTSSANAGKCG